MLCAVVDVVVDGGVDGVVWRCFLVVVVVGGGSGLGHDFDWEEQAVVLLGRYFHYCGC